MGHVFLETEPMMLVELFDRHDLHDVARREAEVERAGDWTKFELGFEPDWFGDEQWDYWAGTLTAA